MYRVSVAEAASHLGISQDAVYKRIKRGTIRWEKGEEDKTYVWIEEQDSSTDSLGKSTDNLYDTSTDRSADLLLDELRDRIRFLEAELDDRKEETRRKDSIIMALTQRIPELEAPRETPPDEPGATVAASEGASNDLPPEPQEPAQRRSWLYRFFFGP
jgi:hypothetical protein